MKKRKKMPLVILTLMVLVLIASISIFAFNARETKNKDSVLLEEKKTDVVKDEKIDGDSNKKVKKIESIDKPKEESKKKENTNNTSSTSSSNKKESIVSNQKPTQPSNNTNATNNSKKSEETVVNQNQTNNTQTNHTQSSNNVTTDPYNYITGGVIDAPTKDACLAKGDVILNRHLDELIDYNSIHMDNQKSQDITNLECYPVHKPDQDGWFLNILCNSGNCNSKYK